MIAGNATRGGDEAHRLAVAAVEGKGNTDTLAVVAADLEPIGTPTAVAFSDSDPAFMSSCLPTCVPLQEQAVLLHHPPDPLVVWRRRAGILLGLPAQDGMDAPVSVGWHVRNNGFDAGEEISIRLRGTTASAWRRGFQLQGQG
jgi:hypothetical protein